MNFTANRMLLYDAVKTVLKVVNKNKGIPEISGVLIEANADTGILTLTGTDIRTHIQRRLRQEHIVESGSIILNPILSEMLRLLAGETVTFQNDGQMIRICSGNCKYTVPYLRRRTFRNCKSRFRRIPFKSKESILL